MSSLKRPEWVKCIAHPHTDSAGLAWCGRKLQGFSFVNTDHAALNGVAKGRLVACRDCTYHVAAALTEGQTDD